MMPVTHLMSSGMASHFTSKKMSRPGDPENAGGRILRSRRPAAQWGGSYGKLASEPSLKLTCIELTTIVLFTVKGMGLHRSSMP